MDNEHNIVAHGPTVPAGGGMLARRTVLRDMGTEYVVHTQVFHENGGTSFSTGNYFNDWSAAVARFRERMIS